MKRILRGKLYFLRKSDNLCSNNNNEPNTYGRAQLRTSNLQIPLSAKGKKIIWVEHNILKVYRIIKKEVKVSGCGLITLDVVLSEFQDHLINSSSSSWLKKRMLKSAGHQVDQKDLRHPCRRFLLVPT